MTFDPTRAPLVRTDVPGPRSRELWARDATFHASNSSPPAQWLRLVLQDGQGAVVRDVDGNLFVDFSSGAVVANVGLAPAAVAAARAGHPSGAILAELAVTVRDPWGEAATAACDEASRALEHGADGILLAGAPDRAAVLDRIALAERLRARCTTIVAVRGPAELRTELLEGLLSSRLDLIDLIDLVDSPANPA